jgi:hypothetical protein
MSSWSTPKRMQAYFATIEGAELFAAQKREGGARDVAVVPTAFPDDRGANVIWTEHTED